MKLIYLLLLCLGLSTVLALHQMQHSDRSHTLKSAPLQQIPIDSSRWFYLHHVNRGIAQLFDGDTLHPVKSGYARFKSSFACVYPLDSGEHIIIRQIRFFDGPGDNVQAPFRVYGIRSNGEQVLLASFNGDRYQCWTGTDSKKELATPACFEPENSPDDLRYILIRSSGDQMPAEMRIIGQYIAPAENIPAPSTAFAAFDRMVGTNGFEWDFVQPAVSSRKIDSVKFNAIRQFPQFRHYLDWSRMENKQAEYTFSPAHGGGWDYDMTYEACRESGTEVLVCLKNIPEWLKKTYPEGSQADDNVPAPWGQPRDKPESYQAMAAMGFQFAARYGANARVPLQQIQVHLKPRWPQDPSNKPRRGLNLVHYIECGNEYDKWWKGANGYMNCYEYAALLSAFYDGHKGTLGEGYGVKNADSSMQVVIGGLAKPDPSYIRGMLEWCRQNRGYRKDGTVDICWDIINFHYYPAERDGFLPRWDNHHGKEPETGGLIETIHSFKELSARYLNQQPVWITELGYDLNPGSPQSVTVSANQLPQQVQASWLLRAALLSQREGLNHLFLYELKDFNTQSPVKFASMGFVNADRSSRLALQYLKNTQQLLSGYSLQKTIPDLGFAQEYISDQNRIIAAWQIQSERELQIPAAVSEKAAIYTFDQQGRLVKEELLPRQGNWVIHSGTTPVFLHISK